VRRAALVLALALCVASPAAGAHRFAFVLSDDRGFRVDSRAGTVTKDMVIGPDTTVALRLTRDELRRIEEKCRTWHILRVHEPHPPYALPVQSYDPSLRWTLEVWMDGAHRRFTWVEWAQTKETPAWHALFAVENRILSIVHARPEWANLPYPRGGIL